MKFTLLSRVFIHFKHIYQLPTAPIKSVMSGISFVIVIIFIDILCIGFLIVKKHIAPHFFDHYLLNNKNLNKTL